MSQQIRDVNLEPNWAVIYEYFIRTNASHTLAQLYTLLPHELSERCKDMSAVRSRKRFHKYPDTWVSLGTWDIVEQALIRVLGHGYHLREVGRYSRFASFGMDAFRAAVVDNWLGRLLTSPIDGYKNTEQAAKRFVKNKDLHFLHTNRGEGYIVLAHKRDIARPIDDFWSVSSYIVGHLDSVPLHWRQTVDSRARSTVVAVDPVELLQREAAGVRASVENGEFIINGEVHGHVMYAQPDTSGFILDGEDVLVYPIPGAIPVIKITKSFATACDVCTKNDTTNARHELLSHGQLFQISDALEHQIPNSCFSIYWQSGLLEFLKRPTGRFVMNRAIAAAQVEVELTDAQRNLDQLTTYLERMSPTKRIASLLAAGNLEPFEREVVVLQFDVVGCTETIRERHLNAAQQAELFGGLLSQLFQEGIRFGGWDYKAVGDCGVMVFAHNWPRDENEVSFAKTLREASRNAMRAAYEMHKIAHVYGQSLRIGIHFDTSHWYDMSQFGFDDMSVQYEGERPMPRFEANGDAFNIAARLEHYTKSDTTAVSNDVIEVAHGKSLVDKARDGALHMYLSGFKPQGAIEVKGFGDIFFWVRTEYIRTEFPEEFSGMEILPIESQRK